MGKHLVDQPREVCTWVDQVEECNKEMRGNQADVAGSVNKWADMMFILGVLGGVDEFFEKENLDGRYFVDMREFLEVNDLWPH